MKSISRDHNFENKLNLVQKKHGAFYVFHELNENPVILKSTPATRKAFNEENWEYFEDVEAEYFCRTY